MDFLSRRTKLAGYMSPQSVLIIHAGQPKHRSQDTYYNFEVSRNFYYLTGLNHPNMILVIHKQTKISTLNSYLFIEPANPVKAKWEGPVLTQEDAAKMSKIEPQNIRMLSEFDEFFQQLTVHSRTGVEPVQTVYLDLYRVHGNENPEAFAFTRKIQSEYPELNIENSNSYFSVVRSTKSEEEVKAIEKAITKTATALSDVWSKASKATNEADLLATYTSSLIRQQTTESFDSIVASGANATILHYVKNNAVINNGDLVLTDVGCLDQLYASDITRTWPVSGKFTKEQKALYDIVLATNKACISMLKPGVTWDEINQTARLKLKSGLVQLGIMSDDDDIRTYFYHGIGHHLGLDVHDAGVYATPLAEGNVITIEPGLYFEDAGLGIRIEDDVLITKTGHRVLSSQIPKETSELEAVIK